MYCGLRLSWVGYCGHATVRFIFPADSFKSDTAYIQITPPQGEPVTVDYSLNSMR
jgi:hypothetical protein